MPPPREDGKRPSRGPVVPLNDDLPDDEATQIGKIDVALVRAQSRRDRAYLIVLAGENIGQMFPVPGSEATIGRALDATIRLQDDGVSRRHAKITLADGEVSVQDLNSANGTLVNGQRIDRAALRDGDKIQVGSTTILKFTYADRLEEDFQQKMYQAALHDGLTKAFCKRYFLDRLPTEIAYSRRHGSPLSLVMLDVDHFKNVNDRHGHPAGDYVLATMSEVIMGALRTEDLFARYGGEEFSVLCRGVTLDNAAYMAERLRGLIQSTAFVYQGTRIPVTVSMGVASGLVGDDAATHLIARADAALYEAKRGGRNRVVRAPEPR